MSACARLNDCPSIEARPCYNVSFEGPNGTEFVWKCTDSQPIRVGLVFALILVAFCATFTVCAFARIIFTCFSDFVKKIKEGRERRIQELRERRIQELRERHNPLSLRSIQNV